MVRISIEVSNGAARFSVSVQAESIERHNPGKDCKVGFPIEAEAFFSKDSVAQVGMVGMQGYLLPYRSRWTI